MSNYNYGVFDFKIYEILFLGWYRMLMIPIKYQYNYA
jgi:hypothetical protein